MSEFNGPAQPAEGHERIVGRGIEQALRYAALSGPFDPAQALRTLSRVESLEPDRLTEIAAGLSQACDRSTTAGAQRWLMRGAERRRTLDELARSNQIHDAVVRRRETADDQPTRDLLNAIEADGIFSAAAVSAALGPDPDRDTLQRLAVGLGRAGPLAPQYENLPRIKAALTNVDLAASAAAPRTRGFYGRENEVEQLVAWLEAELSAAQETVLYVEGLPWTGSASILDQVAATLIGKGDWVVVRLDFDRAGLDVQDTVGLTVELARQVSAQVPGAEQPIQQARHLAASALPGGTPLKGGGPELIPEDLAIALGNALTSPRRHVLLMLDALEALRDRGKTHPGRLFDWLDQIATQGRLSVAVVGAGRRDAPHSQDRSTSFRSGRIPSGAALDPDAARELRSVIDRADWLEGNDIYERAFAGAVFDPNSSEADAALTFLWRCGRWSEARRLLDAQGGWHRREPSLRVQLDHARFDATCRLEIAAEFDFDRVVAVLRTDATLRDKVADLMTEPPQPSLAGAALRFALHRAAVSVAPRPTNVDAAGAAIDRWRPDRPPHEAPIGAEAASIAFGWDLITARTGPIDVDQADGSALAARILAVLTPFLGLIETTSRLPGHLFVGDYAAAVQPHLNELGNLAPLGSPPWRDYVDTADSLKLPALNDLGLLAELVGAAAYVERNRDLTLVARCAERWRRTVAGSWSYGNLAKPPGWDRRVDVTIADRIAALVHAPDAVDQARAQLAAWCPEPPRNDDVLTLLRSRAPRTMENAVHAASDGGALGAAAVLARHVPSAFVPGLALLSSAGPRRT